MECECQASLCCNAGFLNVILSFSPHLDKHSTGSLQRLLGQGEGCSLFSRLYRAVLCTILLPEGESSLLQTCQQRTLQINKQQAANRIQPYIGTERTFQAGNCYTLILFDQQSKGGHNLKPSAPIPWASQEQPQCSWQGWATFHWEDSALQCFESKVPALQQPEGIQSHFPVQLQKGN